MRAARFERSGRSRSALLLLILGGLIAWGWLAGTRDTDGDSRASESTDAALYQAVIERVADGTSYYEAVAVEQATRGYPTSPVMTVREPVLAWASAAAGPAGTRAIFLALIVVALTASVVVFEKITSGVLAWSAATVIAGTSLAVMAAQDAIEFHDVWAGLLLYLAGLALRLRTLRTAVVLVLMASVIRELAAPVLVVLVALAVTHRRRDLPVATAAVAAFVAFYAWHAWRVSQVVGVDGPESQGWAEFHGWPFVVSAVRFGSPLLALPHVVAVVVVPLALLGWASCRGRVADFVVMTVLGYALLLMVVGRWENVYWGSLFALVLLPGLAFAPAGVTALVRNVRGGGPAARLGPATGP